MRKMPFKAYDGNDNFIFISYAHRDSNDVFKVIEALNCSGERIWYDEGIEAGSEWAKQIGEHMEKASAILLFLSRNSINSQNVQREIVYALEHRKPLIIIDIGDTKLTDEMKSQLMVYQMIKLKDYDTYGSLSGYLINILAKYKTNRGETFVYRDKKIVVEKVMQVKKMIVWFVSVIAFISAIVLMLNMGVLDKYYTTVPNVVGMRTEQARYILEDAGFECTESLIYNDTVDYGYIISQSKKGGSRTFTFIPIVVRQSLGPDAELVSVPDVVGLNVSKGIVTLLNSKITRFSINPDINYSNQVGMIIHQSIPAGIEVSRRSNIDLSVNSAGEMFTIIVNGVEYEVDGTESTIIEMEGEAHEVSTGPYTGTETGTESVQRFARRNDVAGMFYEAFNDYGYGLQDINKEYVDSQADIYTEDWNEMFDDLESQKAFGFFLINDILNGTTDNSINPYGDITRAQIAMLFTKIVDKIGITLPSDRNSFIVYDDLKDVPWAEEAIKKMTYAGVFRGIYDSDADKYYFKPNEYMDIDTLSAMLEVFLDIADDSMKGPAIKVSTVEELIRTLQEGALRVEIIGNITIPEDMTVTIGENVSVYFASGGVVTNNGKLDIFGTFKYSQSTLRNEGIVVVNGEGRINSIRSNTYNFGTMNIAIDGRLDIGHISRFYQEDGLVSNDGTIIVFGESSFYFNGGEIVNDNSLEIHAYFGGNKGVEAITGNGDINNEGIK